MRLAREGVGVHRGRAPRAYLERVQAGRVAALPSAYRYRAQVGDVVERLGFAIAAANQRGIPEQELAGAIQSRADLHYGRRPERVEEEFLFAIPHHLHGSAGDFRQARGRRSLRRGCLAAEAAAHIRCDDAHVLLGKSQGLRDHRLRHIGRLRAGPHRGLAVFHDRGSGVGLHGSVRHVAIEVRLFDNCHCLLFALLDVSGRTPHRPSSRRGLQHMVENRRVVDRWRRRIELRFYQL